MILSVTYEQKLTTPKEIRWVLCQVILGSNKSPTMRQIKREHAASFLFLEKENFRSSWRDFGELIENWKAILVQPKLGLVRHAGPAAVISE